jgi:hypothetical protein
MKETSTSAFSIFSNPAAAPDAAAHRRAAAPERPGASAVEHSAAPSGGAASGPSSGYSDRVIQILCQSIRQFGLSDSAAAVKAGMTATTLGQWKREFPEIAL